LYSYHILLKEWTKYLIGWRRRQEEVGIKICSPCGTSCSTKYYTEALCRCGTHCTGIAKSRRFNAYILQVASVNTPSLIDMINFLIAEREAAFNLLSAYNSSENIEAKTPKEKQRVRIALQVLERYVLRFTRELCLYAYVRGCLHCISRDNSL
jgi:hypothetical protein